MLSLVRQNWNKTCWRLELLLTPPTFLSIIVERRRQKFILRVDWRIVLVLSRQFRRLTLTTTITGEEASWVFLPDTTKQEQAARAREEERAMKSVLLSAA